MTKILAIMRKDLKLRFSDKIEWLFFLVLPVIFTLLGSKMMWGRGGDSRIVIVVVDQDQSALSADLLRLLEYSEAVNPVVEDLTAAETMFKEHDASAILVIPAGMEAKLEAGEPVALDFRKAPGGNNGLAAQQEVQRAVGQISRALAMTHASMAAAAQRQPFNSDPEIQAYYDASLTAAQRQFAEAPIRIVITTPETALASAEEASAAHASAGQLIIWVFIPLLGTSVLMTDERVNGTLRRLVTTPTAKATFLGGTIGGQMVYSLIQMLILVIFGVVVLQVPWGQNPLALLILLVSFGLAAVAMGTALGTFVKTSSQANGISIAGGMVMSLLGGCMVPLELFPPGVATAVHILPTTWAVEGMTELIMFGAGVAEILPYAAVLLGFAVVFFIIGVLRFRYE